MFPFYRWLIFAVSFFLVTVSCGNTSDSDGTQHTSDKRTVQVADAPKISTQTVENKQSDRLQVEIVVDGLEPGTGYFGSIYGDQYYTISQVPIEAGGRAIIEGDKKDGGYFYFVFPDQRTSIPFLLDKDQEFSLKTKMDDLIGSMQVEGSLDNELFYANQKFEQAYQKDLKPINEALKGTEKGTAEYERLDRERDELIAKRDAHIASFQRDYPDNFFTKFKVAGQNPKLTYPKGPDGSIDRVKQSNIYRKEYWDNYDFEDMRLFRTPVFSNKMRNFIERTVPQNADSLIKWADYITRKSMVNDTLFKYTANFIGVKYKKPTFMGGDAVYVHMVKNFFTPELAFWTDQNEIRALQQDATIRGRSLPGVRGNNLVAYQTDGTKTTLHDVDADFTVLYFYSVSCENCQKETPKLVKFYNEWKNKGVEVFAFCIDEDKAAWKQYINKNNMTWTNVIDPNYESNYNLLYHLDVTPEMYVLDKDKTIIAKDLKTFQLAEIIERNR